MQSFVLPHSAPSQAIYIEIKQKLHACVWVQSVQGGWVCSLDQERTILYFHVHVAIINATNYV